MDEDPSSKGLKATQELSQQFQGLLEVLGNENLLFDKQKNADPSSVPAKCEHANVKVADILNRMKVLLKDIRVSYDRCKEDENEAMDVTFAAQEVNGVHAKEEHETLAKLLQMKNTKLKSIIDDLRLVMNDIDKMVTT